MTLIQESIPGLHNGVTQQPETLRLKNQCEVQENAVGSLVRGLYKRPPVEREFSIPVSATTNFFTHTIERDIDENYLVLFSDDNTDPITVWNVITNSLETVKYGTLDGDLDFTEDENVKDYLTAGTESLPAGDRLRATTVADYTIILNRTVEVGKTDTDNLDDSTMPHRLVRLSDGEFVFAPWVYGSRSSGTPDNAPDPSFVEDTLEDVFFHQNRLGFLAKTNIVFSRTAEYTELYPEDVDNLVDSDPIDIGIATTEVTTLREAIPFNKNLLLRADNHQFILSYTGNGLSPTTVAVDRTTKFETIPLALSATAGTNLYFSCPQGEYMAIREYYIQPDTLLEDAADITIHVPNYIPRGDSVVLTAFPQLDRVCVFSSGDQYSVYVYDFYWDGDTKAQSAWSKWTFANPILSIATFGSDFYVLFDISGSVEVGKIATTKDPGSLVCLDKQVKLTGSYDSAAEKTTFTLPWVDPDVDFQVIDPDNLLALNTASKEPDSDVITVSGDMTGKEYIIGQRYHMEYMFSKWVLKGGEGKLQPGVNQIRSIQLYYQDTGYFEVNVVPEARETLTHVFHGVTVNNSKMDTQNLQTGHKRFMVLGRADATWVSVTSNSHLPCAIQGATFEGFYNARGQTV